MKLIDKMAYTMEEKFMIELMKTMETREYIEGPVAKVIETGEYDIHDVKTQLIKIYKHRIDDEAFTFYGKSKVNWFYDCFLATAACRITTFCAKARKMQELYNKSKES